MANTLSIQEVVALFRRYIEDVKLMPNDKKYGPWALSLNKDPSDPDHPKEPLKGTISYSRHLLSGDERGEIEVSVKSGNSVLFRKTYSAEFQEGWLSRGYVVPPEMRVVLDFVREADRPLREKMREEDIIKEQTRRDLEQKEKGKAEAEATEKARRWMR